MTASPVAFTPGSPASTTSEGSLPPLLEMSEYQSEEEQEEGPESPCQEKRHNAESPPVQGKQLLHRGNSELVARPFLVEELRQSVKKEVSVATPSTTTTTTDSASFFRQRSLPPSTVPSDDEDEEDVEEEEEEAKEKGKEVEVEAGKDTEDKECEGAMDGADFIVEPPVSSTVVPRFDSLPELLRHLLGRVESQPPVSPLITGWRLQGACGGVLVVPVPCWCYPQGEVRSVLPPLWLPLSRDMTCKELRQLVDFQYLRRQVSAVEKLRTVDASQQVLLFPGPLSPAEALFDPKGQASQSEGIQSHPRPLLLYRDCHIRPGDVIFLGAVDPMLSLLKRLMPVASVLRAKALRDMLQEPLGANRSLHSSTEQRKQKLLGHLLQELSSADSPPGIRSMVQKIETASLTGSQLSEDVVRHFETRRVELVRLQEKKKHLQKTQRGKQIESSYRRRHAAGTKVSPPPSSSRLLSSSQSTSGERAVEGKKQHLAQQVPLSSSQQEGDPNVSEQQPPRGSHRVEDQNPCAGTQVLEDSNSEDAGSQRAVHSGEKILLPKAHRQERAEAKRHFRKASECMERLVWPPLFPLWLVTCVWWQP